MLNSKLIKGASFSILLVFIIGLLILLGYQQVVEKNTKVKSTLEISQNQIKEPSPSHNFNLSEKVFFSERQKAEIGTVVRSYLLENPTIIQEAAEKLALRRQENLEKNRIVTMNKNKNEILKSPLDFTLGDKDADVLIVEYFDYNCGWCKRALNEVTKLAETDSKVRIIMKELPIFGKHSEFAARAAMASKAQGKYWDYHLALMKEDQVRQDNVLKIAKNIGIDIKKLKAEMENPKYAAAIKRTQRLATELGIEGTPGFIIDNRINPGFLTANQLMSIVSEIRKTGCKFC
ncbi:MAG: hypothetical protein TECD_00035 [Hyphomicrobiaceae bacterium hypho_1]